MLSGPKQKFAEGIATGLSQTGAYLAAYPDSSEDSARRSASALMTNPDIVSEIARLRELAATAENGPVFTLSEKLKFLRSIIETPVGTLNETSELAQEWTEESSERGSRSKVKMPDKLRALELYSKLDGSLKDKIQIGGDAELIQSLGALMREVVT